MRVFEYELKAETAPRIGLIALQTDERIEQDVRRLLRPEVDLFVSRVPSGLDVTPETLQSMDATIPAAAALLPQTRPYEAIGYGCTSGTAQIGAARVAEQVRAGAKAATVSDPLTALIACCNALKIKRLAFLSPYLESVSNRLRQVLSEAGVETPVFGSFAEAEEARVARITPRSLIAAGADLVAGTDVDGLFLSCTNLDTLDAIAALRAQTGVPVLSSNQVLVWHLCRLAGVSAMPDPALEMLG
ncbi:MAG: aspartate/glutamate racemase family protein [Arenibacterium sp.]